MKQLPTVYSPKSNKNIQQWTIFVDGNTFWTEAGQVGGKITKSKPTIAKGNTRKTPEEDAFARAEKKWKDKMERSGFATIEEAKNAETKKKFIEPMLAQNADKVDYPLPILSQPKFDGMRAIITKDGAFTRRGKRWVSVPHIVNELNETIFKEHPDIVLDGELYSHEYKDNFDKIASIIKRTKPTDEDFVISERYVKYHCYDAINNQPFYKRREYLENLLKPLTFCVAVPTIECKTKEEVQRVHDSFLNDGYEGSILRVPDAPYVNGRTKNLLKKKDWMDGEFEILRIIEGEGNKAGMAGSVDIQLWKTVGNANIKADHERLKEIWENREQYIGTMAKVQYFGVGSNGKLRFPYVIEFNRTDNL